MPEGSWIEIRRRELSNFRSGADDEAGAGDASAVELGNYLQQQIDPLLRFEPRDYTDHGRPREVQPRDRGRAVGTAVLGGLHHSYRRAA